MCNTTTTISGPNDIPVVPERTWEQKYGDAVGFAFVIIGVAALGLGIGAAAGTVGTEPTKLPTAPHYGHSSFDYTSGDITSSSCLPGFIVGLVCMMVGAVMMHTAYRQNKAAAAAEQQAVTTTTTADAQSTAQVAADAQKSARYRRAFLITGIFIIMLGIGMFTFSSVLHNSNSFSNPDNARWYASMDEAADKLTARAVIGSFIAIAGGALAVFGYCPGAWYWLKRKCSSILTRTQENGEPDVL